MAYGDAAACPKVEWPAIHVSWTSQPGLAVVVVEGWKWVDVWGRNGELVGTGGTTSPLLFCTLLGDPSL